MTGDQVVQAPGGFGLWALFALGICQQANFSLGAARSRMIRQHGRVLNDWIKAVKDELGIDLDVDVTELLDMTRDVAHGVARPAAPLTAFLVGFAAARAGGDPAAVTEANKKAAALAVRWAQEDRG